jgi:hypothetical protein
VLKMSESLPLSADSFRKSSNKMTTLEGSPYQRPPGKIEEDSSELMASIDMEGTYHRG